MLFQIYVCFDEKKAAQKLENDRGQERLGVYVPCNVETVLIVVIGDAVWQIWVCAHQRRAPDEVSDTLMLCLCWANAWNL